MCGDVRVRPSKEGRDGDPAEGRLARLRFEWGGRTIDAGLAHSFARQDVPMETMGDSVLSCTMRVPGHQVSRHSASLSIDPAYTTHFVPHGTLIRCSRAFSSRRMKGRHDYCR